MSNKSMKDALRGFSLSHLRGKLKHLFKLPDLSDPRAGIVLAGLLICFALLPRCAVAQRFEYPHSLEKDEILSKELEVIMYEATDTGQGRSLDTITMTQNQ